MFAAFGCERRDAPRPSAAPDAAAPDAIPVELDVFVPSADRRFVGAVVCSECHREEYDLWRGSHHDLAMQPATPATVLGDFDDARFEHLGDTTTFFRQGDRFMVNTEGPDGRNHAYEIAYTFGVEPLQQYLIRFPGGRYQALGICWDNRPASEGGRRWFHLYHDEKIEHDDVLHWTGLNQNWNYMCAECHSTNLRRNYDPEAGSYRTTWTSIDVSCESCHGPGARHVTWARSYVNSDVNSDVNTDEEADDASGDMGLLVRLKGAPPGRWMLNPDTMHYERKPPLASRAQLEACAPCHSRRHVISDGDYQGKPLLDTHQPAILSQPVYEADGQIRDEVYVYGSFLQSLMYRKGVRCTDCHEPHGLELHATGNALCAQCHLSDRFDTPKHHFHEPGTPGAQCVECHMPARTYMQIDRRHDHSFRVPRPDMSIDLGTPNACNDCHHDRDARWASEAIARWHGPNRRQGPHYGHTLHAGHDGLPGADEKLTALAANREAPGIVRATALSLIQRRPSVPGLKAAAVATLDRDPLVRLHAVRALERMPDDSRMRLAGDLLNDPVRAVRVEATRVFATAHAHLPDALRRTFDANLQEYIDAQMASAERAAAHLNLGNLYRDLGWIDRAEKAFTTAITAEPKAVQSYINLADLYQRAQGREARCAQTLRRAIEAVPDSAEAHHALGLSLIRQNRRDEACESLERAAGLAPHDPYMSYVYGIALESSGEHARAVRVLEQAHRRHPRHRDLLTALVTINRDRGDLESAIRHAEVLVALAPKDQAIRRLLADLKSRQKRRGR